MKLYKKFYELSQGQKNHFDLSDTTLESALNLLEMKANLLRNQKGKNQRLDDFDQIIAPLLALENESKKGKTPWRVVIDMPTQNQTYLDNPTIQFCSGEPHYDRLILNFSREKITVKIDKSCIEKNPDLSVIKSQFSPDGYDNTLEKVKTFYDSAEIQRIAILGSARVFPYQKFNKLEESFEPLTCANKWGRTYTGRVEDQLSQFLDKMDKSGTLYTTVNGGWAGAQEQSMGVPMMSNIFGAIHENESDGIFSPITVMPKAGAFDRVKTRAESYSGNNSNYTPHISTYFEINGVWGDDSKYLVGLSTALLVFEPYGFWTNIEISNGIAQGKPVAVIVDPENLKLKGKYHDLFKDGKTFVEIDVSLSDGSIGSYRLYKNAAEAAEWFNNCYLELQYMEKYKERALLKKQSRFTPQFHSSQEPFILDSNSQNKKMNNLTP